MDLNQLIPDLDPPVGGLARARMTLRRRQNRDSYVAVGLTAVAALVLLIGGLLRPASRSEFAEAILPPGLETGAEHGRPPIALASSDHADFLVVMTPASGGPGSANGAGTNGSLGERFRFLE